MRGLMLLERSFLVLVWSSCLCFGLSYPAHAIDLTEYLRDVNSLRAQEDALQANLESEQQALQRILGSPDFTDAEKQDAQNLFNQEKAQIQQAVNIDIHLEFVELELLHLEQSGRDLNSLIGAAYCDNTTPHCDFSIGDTVLLTYGYVGATSGIPMSGPPVSFVTFDLNVNPLTPDVYVLIGTSFDVADGFPLPFTISAEDSLIRATPFGSAGQPIVITGVDDENVAPSYVVNIVNVVPEPPSLILVGLGVVGLCARDWRRRLASSLKS
jgi:PEP-CTERM motif